MTVKKGVEFFKYPETGIEIVCLHGSMQNYPTHCHVSVYTVSVVLAGEVSLSRQHKTGLLGADEGFLVVPYEAHSLEAQTPYDMLSICINKALFGQLSVSAIYALIKQTTGQGKLDHLLCRENVALIWQFLNDAAYHFARHSLKKPEVHMERIKARVEHSPEDAIRIDNMAHDAHIAPHHFIKRFGRSFGLSPHQFQLYNQIRKARQLLETDLSIAEVAQLAGFYDQSHFIRHFKRRTGLTPTDYQKACRTKH